MVKLTSQGILSIFLLGCGGRSAPRLEEAAAISARNTAQTDPQSPNQNQPAHVGAKRQIVYHTTIDFVVEDFSGVPEKVQQLLASFDAFVADSQVAGVTSSPRRGYWKIRVPVDRFEEFVVEARGLGEIRSESQTSEDVSEEFSDLQAQLRNKKQEEERLQALLNKHSGKLEEILAVEREVTRVRGEVERLQGRERVLTDLTALATVTLEFEELKNYVPALTPKFSVRVSRSWRVSVELLTETAQQTVVVTAFMTPWLVVLGLPTAAVVGVLRIRRRRNFWEKTTVDKQS